jgi:hypothetical protein
MKRNIGMNLAAALLWSLSLGAQDARQLSVQNRRLENELSLARKPVSYMVIDLEAKKVTLRSRGMVLKKWDVRGFKTWGKPIPDHPLKLLKKTALTKPKRTNITPGQEETKKKSEEKKDTFDIGTLELKDMPVHYDLVFEGNIRISVRPRTKRVWPALRNIAKSVSWLTYLPFKTVWFSARGKSFTQIQLVMGSEKDAQGIYWAFLDGHGTLIYR